MCCKIGIYLKVSWFISNKTRKKPDCFTLMSQVAAVFDVMGEASAKAQGLKTAITSGISHFEDN